MVMAWSAIVMVFLSCVFILFLANRKTETVPVGWERSFPLSPAGIDAQNTGGGAGRPPVPPERLRPLARVPAAAESAQVGVAPEQEQRRRDERVEGGVAVRDRHLGRGRGDGGVGDQPSLEQLPVAPVRGPVRALDLDKRFIAPVAVVVDRLGYQIFPRAGFA